MSLKKFIFWYVSRKCVPARKSATIKLVHNWESENMRFLEVNVVACSLLKNEFSNSANKTQSPKRLFQDLFRSVSSEVTTLFRRITAEYKLERPDDNIPHTRNWKFSYCKRLLPSCTWNNGEIKKQNQQMMNFLHQTSAFCSLLKVVCSDPTFSAAFFSFFFRGGE